MNIHIVLFTFILKEMCERKIGMKRGKDMRNVAENKSQKIF